MAVTLLVAVSITETVLSPEFIIYAYGPIPTSCITVIVVNLESVPFSLVAVRLTE